MTMLDQPTPPAKAHGHDAADGQAARLARIKAVAAAALAAAIATAICARWLEARHPGWGFVAAFAEAAAIGGLADWYAVVALFRRPLGLPIPHTAIIPENQQRIGDNLGRFIERQFLSRGPVEAKLREIDFTALMASWLSDRDRSGGLAAFVTRVLPRALEAMEASALKEFINRKMRAQIDDIEIAPLAAKLLLAMTDDGRHQKLLDQLLNAFHALLQDEKTIDSMRDKIRDELPAMFRAFRAEGYVLRKLLNSAFSFISDVRDNPSHPLRSEFDGYIHNFIHQLQTSPDYAARAAQIRDDFLARPEWRSLGQSLWANLKDYVATDSAAPDSAIRQHVHSFLIDLGHQLENDAQMRRDMNEGLIAALTTFVETHKSGFAIFIADQVKGWDMTQLVRLIELNIGRDLQYIRFNGMIIGGIAGLALHAAKVFLALD